MSPNNQLAAAVFDLDGLMFNTEEIYHDVGGEILRRRGKELDGPLLDQMMGRTPRIALQFMIDRHSLDDTVEQLMTETDQLFSGQLDQRLDLMPGLAKLLTALESAEIPKAIATSSRASFAHDLLDRFDLRGRFEFVLTCDDVTRGKPDPEIYLTAAHRLNLSPEQMLVFEDSANGARAAVAAGAFAVAVPGDHSRDHDFSGVALIVESLADHRIYTSLRIEAV